MKRVRHEQIYQTVHQYLKRRQFGDSEVVEKKERRWIQDVKDMALKTSVSGETTTENILSFSSITGDTTVCEQQFTRLKNYLHDAVEPYRTELKQLLYPTFVQIFLQLLCNGHKAPAHRFLGRHIKMFENESSLQDVLEALRKLYSRSDVLACKEATHFREQKISVCLSEEAMEYLKKYLKVDDNMMLLQIFNQHLKFEVKHEDSSELQLKEGASDKVLDSQSAVNEKKRPTDIVRLLQQCIKKVREGPPCLSSICFYTFLNAYQGLCTVDVSPDKSLLSAGFEDSTIKLWSVTPGMIQSCTSISDPSKIYLAADYWNNEEEENSSPRYKEVANMRGHNGAVYKTCFNSDSNGLLSCSEDCTVRLWDLKSHTNKVCYQGHNYPVWDIDTSSVGSYFVSGSQDKTAKLWLTDRIYPLRSFIGHTSDVDSVKFHPNCNYVATGSSDRTVRLWSIQEGKSVRLMQGHRGSVMSLAFSPNGQYLASAGDDKRIRVWDLSTGMLFKEFRGHTDTVHTLCFNKDSSFLASGGLDCSIKIWDVRKSVSSSSVSDSHTSPELLGSFSTKSATVTYLMFTKHNLLQAAGAI